MGWAQTYTHTHSWLPTHPSHLAFPSFDLQFAVQKMQGHKPQHSRGWSEALLPLLLQEPPVVCQVPRDTWGTSILSAGKAKTSRELIDSPQVWVWWEKIPQTRNVLLKPAEKLWELLTWKWRVKKPDPALWSWIFSLKSTQKWQHWIKGHRIYWCADFKREMH